VATLRPDGFAAATPADPARPGTIESTTFSFQAGDEFLLTADTDDTGRVEVELLDVAGHVLARSAPLAGSFTARSVAWLAPLPAGRHEVRLRFTLKGARFYSYEQLAAPVAGERR